MPSDDPPAPTDSRDPRSRLARLRAGLDRRQPDLTVLMERVNKPHNFSAILRSCDAVGVLDVHVVPPDRGLALHDATSGGTAKWMVVHQHASGTEAVDELKGAGHRIIAADPGPGAVDFREVDYVRPSVIVMGAELYGISEAVRVMADVRVLIPMRGMARSLNVSVATALLLYEAERQRSRAGLYDRPRLPAQRREHLLFEWMHPRIARHLREAGSPYPAMAEDGSIKG